MKTETKVFYDYVLIIRKQNADWGIRDHLDPLLLGMKISTEEKKNKD